MNNFTAKAKGFITGAMMVPLMGIGAHFFPYEGEMGDDYSLKHRFETAYSFNTPESHRTYHFTPEINGVLQSCEVNHYMASPWATYPAMLIFGLLGARGRWDEKIKRKIRDNFMVDER